MEGIVVALLIFFVGRAINRAVAVKTRQPPQGSSRPSPQSTPPLGRMLEKPGEIWPPFLRELLTQQPSGDQNRQPPPGLEEGGATEGVGGGSLPQPKALERPALVPEFQSHRAEQRNTLCEAARVPSLEGGEGSALNLSYPGPDEREPLLAPGVDLKLDASAMVRGVIMAEILGRRAPRGRRQIR